MRIVIALVVGLVTAALVMAVTALISRRVGRLAVVDVAWGPVFVAIAFASLGVRLADGESGTAVRSWLLAALTTVWGVRLAWHIGRRAKGRHDMEDKEDPRYAALVAGVPEQKRFGYAIKRVFGTQGVVAWFVSFPLQVAATTGKSLGVVAWIGVAIWLVGFGFEAIGDAQMSRFKADSGNRGRIMDTGLWGWTRHPNYFGDALVWWGLFVVAAEAWPGVLTVLSPVAMTYFLAFKTGGKLMDAQMADRPGYREYMQRTSGFVPRPPMRRV